MKLGVIEEQRPGSLVRDEDIEAVVQAIGLNFRPEKIVLFGSYAGGDPSVDSDLDLLVIMDSDLPRHKRATPIRLLFRPAPCAMDIVVYTPEEVARWNGTVNHIVTEALRSGRTVYERPKH